MLFRLDRRRRAVVLAAALSILAVGCVGSLRAAEPDAAGTEFFEKQIRPILVKHCYECHADGEKAGGLVLDTRAGLLGGGDSGPAITVGKPNESRLIEAVRYKNPDLQMPPQGRLAAGEIAALEKWITMGAPDPRTGPVAAVAVAAPLAGMSIEEGRKFWSFQPIAKPQPPRVRRADWVRTPIDAFILQRLEAAGLEPAAPADKRTLIRRATYDLTGLPPTPAEIEAFLADELPDAFDRVVERLLNSPQYGVRWGRHWLDVARYADSNGLDENLAFGNAWRYRDYVIAAFQQDKPYDRFLIEQLAGDLLPDADAATKTATGFLALGAKVLAEPDRVKLEMDTIDEQLDTIGKCFLGMTLGCVRCHDHKFDPVKQSDYYALAAIFKSTRTFADSNTGAIKHWYEHDLASAAEREAMKKVDAEIAEKKKAAATFKSNAVAKLRAEARTKAADYLAAAAQFDPSASLTQVEAIALPLGLHPHILHHCRRHVEFHRDDPLLRRWHELRAAGDLKSIRDHYARLFADAEAAWTAAKKADPKATALKDSRLEDARAALNDAEGLLAIPTRPEFAFDDAVLEEYNRLAEEARIVESRAADLASAMGVADGKVQPQLAIHIRGSHANLGKLVSRGFPEVMCEPHHTTSLPPDRSGRLELARWLADAEHPLTSRVYVNRIWRWHFGTGLVASTDNFGKLGDRPSHPELLDWLARYFTSSGWSTKAVHRLIMRSSVYQTASTHARQTALTAADPENRLLAKSPLRRLEAEEIRDAVLAVAGRLDKSLGGKSVPLRNRQFVFDHTSKDHTKYDSLRRAVYLPVIRNNLYALFEQFDFPDPTMPTGNRNSTTVAPQALVLLNSDLVMDSAAAWAERLLKQHGDDSARIRAAYESAFGRLPSEAEIHRAAAFLRSETTSAGRESAAKTTDPAATRRAWGLLCHSLLAGNEFIYLR